jgi:hypothetical protein
MKTAAEIADRLRLPVGTMQTAAERMEALRAQYPEGPLDLRALYRELADYLRAHGVPGDTLVFEYEISNNIESLIIRWAPDGVLSDVRLKIGWEPVASLASAFNPADPTFAQLMKRNEFETILQRIQVYQDMIRRGWQPCLTCRGRGTGEGPIVCSTCNLTGGTWPK